ncbi:MAG TPA: dihydrodipicolinate synthase family protein [Gaiellaceae bacterium]|nr:dihydrodipicolinate synthase family protein [Gaiellaceae bacterium]
MLRGALAAAVTPLRDDGAALDEDAFGPYLDFLAAAGLDGVLALGTTGEGVLLSAAERRRVAELFLDGPLPVIVHCGAQTTAETTALAEHAAASGAAGVAVISPPYFALDDESLLAHLAAAARAAGETPFYVYEFKARSGYAVPLPVLERLRERAPNFAGLKVSDKPFEALEPYLLDGLDVFVGAEELVLRGVERGAVGTVSGLGSVFPERVVALIRDGDGDIGALRAGIDRFPFQAAAKYALGRRGVPVREDVRAPLRRLGDDEKRELDAWLESS